MPCESDRGRDRGRAKCTERTVRCPPGNGPSMSIRPRSPFIFHTDCVDTQAWLRRCTHGNFASLSYSGTFATTSTCRMRRSVRCFQNARIRSGDVLMSIRSNTRGVHSRFQYRQTGLIDPDSLSAALQTYLKSSGGSAAAVRKLDRLGVLGDESGDNNTDGYVGLGFRPTESSTGWTSLSAKPSVMTILQNSKPVTTFRNDCR